MLNTFLLSNFPCGNSKILFILSNLDNFGGPRIEMRDGFFHGYLMSEENGVRTNNLNQNYIRKGMWICAVSEKA